MVQPIQRSGEAFEQTAIYERVGYKNNQGPHYFGCGSITLQRQPDAIRLAEQRGKEEHMPFVQRFTVRGFLAFRWVPQCGNDVSLGSTTVHFDDDKILIVSANH